MNRLTTTAAVVSFTALSFPAHATLGIFEHGSGIKSLGFGGVSYVGIEETTALNANPALATGMGNRFDIGIDVLRVSGGAEIVGNAAGPDDSFQFKSNYYPIPQVGYSTRFEERWTFGVTAFAAGLGPIYPQGPYARFAGPDDNGRSDSAQTSLKVAGVTLVMAYEAFPGQSFAVAANVVNQWLSVEGLLPFAPLSERPESFSNQGGHVSYGIGFTVGWAGRLTDWLDGGLSYRSQVQQLPIQEYSGLLPNRGDLELPAIFGGALLAKPSDDWKIAVEYQHFAYQRTAGFGNGIDRLTTDGRPFGSSGGPGFGFNNQNVYKLGVEWQATPALALRTGFSYATQLLSKHNILLNLQSPGTPKFHATIGGTWTIAGVHELSGFFAASDRRRVRGENSIPAAFGGGEANISNQSLNIGVSYGRRFGGSDL